MINKKNIIASMLVAMSLTSGIGFAQSGGSANVNAKILEVYGSSWGTINTQDAERLNQLNHLLNNRIQIMEMDSVNAKDKFPALGNQPLFTKYVPGITVDHSYNAATFNPLKYNLKFFEYGDSGYWINGTNKVLFITGLKNAANN